MTVKRSTHGGGPNKACKSVTENGKPKVWVPSAVANKVSKERPQAPTSTPITRSCSSR